MTSFIGHTHSGNEFLLQNGSEDETSFSLRRKLFGQPQRPSLSSSSCSCCHDNDDDSETANPETRDTHVEGVAVTPTELRLSSTPLRSSPSPAAVIITKLTSVEDIASSTNQCSSFIDSSLLNKCSLSPIKLEPEVTPPTSSFNEVGSGQLQLVLSPIVSEAVDTSIESHFNSLSSTPHSIVKSISSTSQLNIFLIFRCQYLVFVTILLFQIWLYKAYYIQNILIPQTQ